MIAVVQFRPRRGARNANLEKLGALTRQALEAGAKMVVLPEMAATGYRFPNPEVVRPMSEIPRGPTWRVFGPLAKEFGAWVVIGFVEDNEGKLYNAAIVINPEGKIEATYRKRLLYIDDHTWANPGDLPYPVWTTPWGVTTLGICMDINDPRFLTHMRKTKPDLLCSPPTGSTRAATSTVTGRSNSGAGTACSRWPTAGATRTACSSRGDRQCSRLERFLPRPPPRATASGWWMSQ